MSSTDIADDQRGAGLYVEARYANDGTAINVADNLRVIADGNNVRGVAASTRGVLNIGKSADITTSGKNAYGVESIYGADVKFAGSADITTSGVKAHGAYADSAAIDLGSNASVTTTGASAYGIFSEYAALIKVGDNSSISTTGDSSTGVRALFGGEVEIGNNVSISTSGKAAHGVTSFTSDSKVKIGNDVTIKTLSDDSVGAYAFRAKIEIGDGAVIATSGDRSSGALAQNLAHVHIGDDAVITTSGLHAYGVLAFISSDASVGNKATINTSGDYGYGVSSYHHSYIDVGDELTVTTSGKNAHGVYATYESSMDIGSSAVITTLSDDAHGIFVDNNASMTVGDSARIATSGNGSHGVYVNDNSSLELDGAVISATGAGSYAIKSDNGSRVTGSGVFDITGDIYTGTDSFIDLTMKEGSLFVGAADVQAGGGSPLSLVMEKSRWNITNDSHLSSLALGETIVDFESSPAFTTLTIDKLSSLVSGTGGTFIMKADIPILSSDRLLVTDVASSGFYNIKVLNIGRAAASGDEILTLAESAFGSSVSFDLTNIVEYGGWQYGMNYQQGAVLPGVGAINNEWQLVGTGRASTPGSGAINSFAGSYLMAYADTQTLIQRMGDLRQSLYGQGLWFRVHGGKFESNAKSYVRGFDMDYGGVQIGYDRKLDNDNLDGELYVGAMFGYGKGDLDYHHEGSGEVDSKTLGVYGTYIGGGGFYIDAVLKYQWMTNDFDVIDTAGVLVRGQEADTGGIGASVEVGQRLHLGNGQDGGTGWYVEPQLQLSYQRQDGGYFNASNGLHIGVEPFTSILARVGMLAGYETEKTNLYAKVSKVKEFDGDLTIMANGIPIQESFASSWWVYGIGYTSRINDRNSLYLDIERTSGGSFRQPWRVFAGWRLEF